MWSTMIRRNIINERKCFRILGFFIIVWLIIVLITLAIIRTREDTNDELIQRLNNAEQALEKIRRENIDLNSRLEGCNYK